MKLLSCTYFSIFFAASAWTEESSKSNTILDLANSACETHISIHAPMKGATEHDISVTSVPLISIRTPTKGATIKSPNSKLFFIISIHAPAKGATMQKDFSGRFAEYFNPRSREGSDGADHRCELIQNISIHAPAKGATLNNLPDNDTKTISIHAPAKGATGIWKDVKGYSEISIHAPAKGATLSRYHARSDQ